MVHWKQKVVPVGLFWLLLVAAEKPQWDFLQQLNLHELQKTLLFDCKFLIYAHKHN